MGVGVPLTPDASVLTEVLNALPHPVCLVDEQGAIAFANDAAAYSLGYRESRDLRGRQSHDTLHHHRPDGTHYPVHECPVLRPFRNQPSVEAQWFFRRDGSSFPIAWNSASIDLGSGHGIVLSFTDVTPRVAAAHRLHRDTPSAQDNVAHRLESMKEFIADHLSDEHLSLEMIARAHHVSTRLVFSSFASAGSSPARYIRQQRLVLAQRLLAHGATVSAAGRRSGFKDSGTFAPRFSSTVRTRAVSGHSVVK